LAILYTYIVKTSSSTWLLFTGTWTQADRQINPQTSKKSQKLVDFYKKMTFPEKYQDHLSYLFT